MDPLEVGRDPDYAKAYLVEQASLLEVLDAGEQSPSNMAKDNVSANLAAVIQR